MKEKFIQLCETSDLVVMGGIPLKYLPSSKTLEYRVFGEPSYFSLDEISDMDISFVENMWSISRFGAIFKFKFYSEVQTELT